MKHDVIIFGINKYSDFKKSNHHNRSYYIINELLKREDIGKILFIDFLPVRRIQAIKQLFTIFSKQFSYLKKRGIFSYCEEIKKNKFFHYVSILSIISWKFLYKDLINLVDKLSFSNLIIWSHYPLNVDYFDYFKNKTTVIYLDSDWQQLKSMKNKSKIDYINVLRKNYNKISDKADYIFAASDDLLEIFMGHKNSYWNSDISKTKISDFNWKKLVDEMMIKINNVK